MMNNERRRHSLSLSLSLHMRVASFVDRVLHRIVANTHSRTHLHGANLGECKKKERVRVYTKKNQCLSSINSSLMSIRFFFLPLDICLTRKTGNNLSFFPSFSLYTHMHTASYAICFVTHAISHACTNSLLLHFFSSASFFFFFPCSGNHQVC